MKKLLAIVLLILIDSFLYAENDSPYNQSFYKIIESTTEYIVIEYNLSQLIHTRKDGFDTFRLKGLKPVVVSKDIYLSQINILLGLPCDRTPEIKIIDIQHEQFPDIHLRAANPEKVKTIPGSIEHLLQARKNKYQEDDIGNPGQPFACSDPVIMRDQIMCTLQFSPFQYDERSNTMTFYRYAKVKINYPKIDKKKLKTSDTKKSSLFRGVLNCALANYPVAQNWMLDSKPAAGKISKSGPAHFLTTSAEQAVKLLISKNGIYKIDKPLLINSGIDVSTVDPEKINIYFEGEAIAIFIDGEADGQFDENDYILFYASKNNSYYSDTNVYWLCFDDDVGKRMILKNKDFETFSTVTRESKISRHFEKNVIYSTSIENGEGVDHWFWDAIIAPDRLMFNIQLNNISQNGTMDCQFKIECRGYTNQEQNPDHHTLINLNDQQICDDFWDGSVVFSKTAEIGQNVLREGQNTIIIDSPGDTEAASDIIFINYIEMNYWQKNIASQDSFLFEYSGTGIHQFEIDNFSSDKVNVFDITNPDPVKIVSVLGKNVGDSYTINFKDDLKGSKKYFVAGENYLQTPGIEPDHPPQLCDVTNSADYIIITHQQFAHDVELLVQHRRQYGLRVKVVDIQDIYDEFNYGNKNPEAIKDFLSYAYFNWQKPAPAYVLLVGDASYDYKDYLGTGNTDLVPTHLFESRYYNTETASDNWFVCVNGDDNMPDMLIGRLPVRTTNELNVVINKIILYETTPVDGHWNKKLLFFADKKDDNNSFKDYSDTLISRQVPEGIDVEKVYLDDFQAVALARQEIFYTINTGCLVAHYFGHGGIEFLAKKKLLTINDVAQFTNHEKQPFLVSLSCLNGFFHHAQIPRSLAESVLIDNEHGMIGCLAPSGFATSGILFSFSEQFFHTLYQNNNNELGALTAQAKLGILKAGENFYDHIDFYNLFGDPALQLRTHFSIDEARISGNVIIDGENADIGSVVIAHIHQEQQIAFFKIITPGYYGPLILPADNIETEAIEGATAGDTVLFKVVTTAGDTAETFQHLIWQASLAQHLDLSNDVCSNVGAELSYEIFMGDNIYGKDFFDGDFINSTRTIKIIVENSGTGLNESRTRLLLDNNLIDPHIYSIENPANKIEIKIPLNSFSDGPHKLICHLHPVDDNFKTTMVEIGFNITSELMLRNVLNYPNPMQHSTSFTYYLVSGNVADVSIKIYTIAGRLIKVINYVPGTVGYNQIHWDGKDEDNDALANGVYFYKIIARCGDDVTENIERFIVMR